MSLRNNYTIEELHSELGRLLEQLPRTTPTNIGVGGLVKDYSEMLHVHLVGPLTEDDLEEGRLNGYEDGYEDGYKKGYSEGYSRGYSESR
jgi:hypothetical protein